MLKKQIILYSFLFSIILLSQSVEAKTSKDTLRVLFVGNSYIYYNNLPQMVSLISDSIDTKLICARSTVGGAHLGEHWNGLRGLKSTQLIQKGKFDIVVIQDNSMWPVDNPDSVYKYAKLLCDLIKSTGAKPYIYETWARLKVPQHQKELNAVYTKVAKDNNATLVPVGEAWEKARNARPDLVLFDADGSHPSNIGTFLIATMFTKKIGGSLPKKFSTQYYYPAFDKEQIRIMQLDELDMIFCKKIVEETLLSKK
jgi:hypothetical protein